MKTVLVALSLLLPLAACAWLPEPGTIGAPADSRYCGAPERDKNGRIKRSQAVLNRFVATFPCPSTMEHTLSCPGWAVDHVIPLASGGCDMQHNLQWLPDLLKSCKGTVCKDRWERRYHGFPREKVVLE